MPVITATTTALRIPQGGYHNARNDGVVNFQIEGTPAITTTSGGTVTPGQTFSWDRDQALWVIAAADCVVEIF